jgi:hypothetical protein
MKKMFTFILLIISLLSNAQNGGQFFENNVIRVNYLGYFDEKHTFTVCNKQNCEARIRTKADQDPAIDIIVKALDCETVYVTRPTNINILFRAKAETACITRPDMGWLEINTTLLTLPLIESNYIFIDRGQNKLEISIKNGIFKSSFTNTTYTQTLRVFNLSGKKLYENKCLVEKTYQSDINSHLVTGINLIEIIIETNKFDRFVFKYFKQNYAK